MCLATPGLCTAGCSRALEVIASDENVPVRKNLDEDSVESLRIHHAAVSLVLACLLVHTDIDARCERCYKGLDHDWTKTNDAVEHQQCHHRKGL